MPNRTPLPTPQFLDRARALHAEHLVMDAHVDTASEMMQKGYDLATAPDTAHLSWDRIAAADLKAQIFACFVPPTYVPDRCADYVDRTIDRFEQEVARFPDRLAPCRSVADIERAVAAGKLAGVLSIEGGHAIEDSLDTLRRFHARGVRAMTLTWNNTNGWADGCGPMDEHLQQHGGLNDLGREVVGTMEELGMAVDVSHAAPATVSAVLEAATRSPFASHSCCRALTDHRRNLTDDQMRALADAGGVMGICFAGPFLHDEIPLWEEIRKTEEYRALVGRPDRPPDTLFDPEEFALFERKVPKATLDDAVRHADHALRVMGTGAVALGGDFDGTLRVPVGLDHVGKLPNLTAGLLELGWKEHELTGFLGRNLLDYLRRVLD